MERFERWYMGPWGMALKLAFALSAVIVSYLVR